MPVVITILAFERKLSYGTHVLDHLTADGTRLTGREVAVVTVFQINADFACRFHLELLESLLGAGYLVLTACHLLLPS